MEKKDAEKGVRARTVVDEEAELIRRDARSSWWVGSQADKRSDRGLRGASGPSAAGQGRAGQNSR